MVQTGECPQTIFKPTSTKQQARKLEAKQNNDHSGGVLLGVKCAHKGDHIPPLERYRQSLKQEHRFCRVPGDCSD